MKMTPRQKVLMKDFSDEYFRLLEKYWNPEEQDSYWDNLTDDAMKLIHRFQTKDNKQNEFMSNLVMMFMQTREE